MLNYYNRTTGNQIITQTNKTQIYKHPTTTNSKPKKSTKAKHKHNKPTKPKKL